MLNELSSVELPTPIMTGLPLMLRLRAGGAVKRYHTFPTLGNQSVAEHSLQVILLLRQLAPKWVLDANLLLAAATHDLAEYDTGDTPANVKWAYPALDDMLKTAESAIEEKLAILPQITAEQHKWLKLADTLEYCLYSLEQRRLGNVNMDIVFMRGMRKAREYELYHESETVRLFVTQLFNEYLRAQTGVTPASVAVEP